jgi:hypothetical protein
VAHRSTLPKFEYQAKRSGVVTINEERAMFKRRLPEWAG